jgi:hypothetical protein
VQTYNAQADAILTAPGSIIRYKYLSSPRAYKLAKKYGVKVSVGTDIYPAEVVDDRALVHARQDSEDANGRQRRLLK